MLNVALGSREEDILTSLANRLIRLNRRMTNSECKEFKKLADISVEKLTEKLLDSFDENVIGKKAMNVYQTSEPDEIQLTESSKILADEAVKPFCNPDVRNFIENIRHSHEQIIDNVNLDTVIFAGYSSEQKKNVERTIKTFREFIKENGSAYNLQ